MTETRYGKEMRTLIENVEKKIGRPMTEAQKQGLRNIGRLMALVNFSLGFYGARSEEQIEAWLEKAEKWKPFKERIKVVWQSQPQTNIENERSK